MSLFKTTPEQFVLVSGIAAAMGDAGLPAAFIQGAAKLAEHDQGIFELLALWREAQTSGDAEERDAIVADLQSHLDDAEQSQATPRHKASIRFNDLPAVATQVLEHKKRLRELIDRHGGVSLVAKRSGIPQPSLSRMLASASMPRKTTLFKLAQALAVPESEVVAEWIR